MDSKSVVLGRWDNHGNEGNLRLSAQDCQKVDRDFELVFKHGSRHISDVTDSSSLRKVLEYTVKRDVEGFSIEVAYSAVELFNDYFEFNLDPEQVISDWELEKKIKS